MRDCGFGSVLRKEGLDRLGMLGLGFGLVMG